MRCTLYGMSPNKAWLPALGPGPFVCVGPSAFLVNTGFRAKHRSISYQPEASGVSADADGESERNKVCDGIVSRRVPASMPACMQHAYFIRMEYTYRHRYTLGVVVLDAGQIMPKMRLANARYISP